jgi:DNA polymerase elongation subunit (family B)
VPLAAYKKDEIDYNLMEESERDKPENRKLISEYLRSDCVYLYELVSRFIESFGMQMTQASAAMQYWKKLSKRPLPRSDADYYAELSPYYYGGRVQCFQQGIIETHFSVYDINSAYPEAMLYEHPYSTEFAQVDGYVKGSDFFRVRCLSHGAFPYRGLGGTDERNYGLWFPADDVEREYTVTGWEYEAAIETGTIEKVDVLESRIFSEHINFADYINHFYEMRLKAKREKDIANDLFAKLLMNSLYGKFAANPENYRNYMIVPMDVIAGLEMAGWSFAGELGPWGLAEAELTGEQMRYYNIATSASITGFVRAKLWRALSSSKGLLYCDTDSIAVEKAGAGVILGKNLGQWKHEGNFDRAGIAGKKLYIFRGVPIQGKRQYKTASKGARLTDAQLWAVAKGIEVEYTPEAPTFSPRKVPVFTTRRLKFTA